MSTVSIEELETLQSLKAEVEHLRKRTMQLRVAFNNVSEEREFLRKQAIRIKELALQIAEACKMYEGQNNISEPEHARFTVDEQ